MKKFLLLIYSFLALSAYAKEYVLKSPNENIMTTVKVDGQISYSVVFKDETLISPSSISLNVNGKKFPESSPKIIDIMEKEVNDVVHPVVREKKAEIVNHFNELKINFRGNYTLVFRAYNEGIAYRFETRFEDDIIIDSEKAEFNFSPEHTIYFPEEDSFISHNERTYIKSTLNQIEPGKFCSLPSLVSSDKGVKILITESNLYDYPGMWLKLNDKHTLSGIFPGYPLKCTLNKDRKLVVDKYADYIAKTKGNRAFPWRALAIAENDTDLIVNQLVYLLAEPNKIEDPSWIKPGKVAWDWWNWWNIYGVDFKAGINTQTYKYYIDFASQYGIEYIILDEGWYKLGNLLELNPDINMEEICEYGRRKNVGIILWVVWKTLDDQLDQALDQFEKWGVKGLKVDFMQRDDQLLVNFYWKVAKEAAARKMIVDFHGAYKPAGLRRTYPNVLTREGVKGMEWCKWSSDVTPQHNVTIPFIRMVAGPMDYTPGAMLNAQESSFRPITKKPMSMGTRCHQLAMYVIYESPLQMLADSPSHYLEEEECMEFLEKVPTVWDETIPLHASVSDYVVLARRNGEQWYVGAMTDENEREFEIDFSFLKPGDYKIDIYQDGVNAHRYASDYKKIEAEITNRSNLNIKLAPGGGWAARIYKK